MNRKLKLLEKIKETSHAISFLQFRTEDAVKADSRNLEFIRAWVDELEELEQAMIKALEPYLPEEQ